RKSKKKANKKDNTKFSGEYERQGLPPELMVMIMTRMLDQGSRAREIIQLSLACKYFWEIGVATPQTANSIWHRLSLERWPWLKKKRTQGESVHSKQNWYKF